MPWRFPIRLKILVGLLLTVTTVVGLITFTMANLFHEDKRTYVNDLASIMALNTADECQSLLVGYSERLLAFGRIMHEAEFDAAKKNMLLERLFDDFKGLVAVTLFNGTTTLASVHDAAGLEDAGLTAESLLKKQLPAVAVVGPDDFVVENITVPGFLPVLGLTEIMNIGDETLVVSGVITLDRLMKLASHASVFEVFLVDRNGTLLAHRDPDRVAQRVEASLPEAASHMMDHRAGMTLEYEKEGQTLIAGVADVNEGDVVVVAQIPSTAAYLASRDLLNRLIVIAMLLLVCATLFSAVGARRLIRPVERLSGATREIAKGKFDISVRVDSNDEIGSLADSFNQMAAELRHRDEALQGAQNQLIQSEKMAAFGQLGAGIAHEVKNPLAGILGCAQLSLRKVEKETPLHRNLSLIEKETKRCRSIIENLLRFARQERGILGPIEINPVIEDAIQIVNHQLEIQKVKLGTDLAKDLPNIRGNANQLQQVLINLMMNAQQAMEGRPGSILVRTRRRDAETVEVILSDTGPGMTKEIQKKIFEPFFTTKPGGKGTGLGLSVSFGIIRDHNGKISVDSAPGKGATFTISLPALGSQAAQPRAELQNAARE